MYLSNDVMGIPMFADENPKWRHLHEHEIVRGFSHSCKTVILLFVDSLILLIMS